MSRKKRSSIQVHCGTQSHNRFPKICSFMYIFWLFTSGTSIWLTICHFTLLPNPSSLHSILSVQVHQHTVSFCPQLIWSIRKSMLRLVHLLDVLCTRHCSKQSYMHVNLRNHPMLRQMLTLFLLCRWGNSCSEVELGFKLRPSFQSSCSSPLCHTQLDCAPQSKDCAWPSVPLHIGRSTGQ